MNPYDASCPNGFSHVKGDSNYFLDAVRDFWAETGLSTDSMELAVIINYFDRKRGGYLNDITGSVR